MLQYLLNATAIWLISLVIFDVFLQKESYHSYNRFYLVFTLLLGIFVPLWQWQEDSPIYTKTLEKPMERVMALKQTIVTAAGPSSVKVSWEVYLGYAYLLGVVITLLLLIAEIIKLVHLYQSGHRSRAGSCIIIETGKDYSPFSLFNLVFVNNRAQYSAEEWDMLIAHEQMHELLFHFIDVLQVQIARIIFWFHPLVYIYQKKLMMLHEYQADKVSNAKPQFYGRFLVEQALLQIAPSITHSFNRSPIKNRIVMLTRTSTAASRSKMLLFIPLALVCLLCFSRNSFSQKFEKNGNMVTYRGNKFELSLPQYDTVIMIDPVDGHEIIKTVVKDPTPLKMNGKKIYRDGELIFDPNAKLGTPVNMKPGLDGNGLKEYLLSNLKDEFNGLPDMQYKINLNNVVLDESGKIVYYENGGISAYKTANKMGDPDYIKLDPAVQNKFSKKINALLDDAPSHSAATLSGDPVPYLINATSFWNAFTLKDHRVSAE